MVYQLFVDFKNTYDSAEQEVFVKWKDVKSSNESFML